MPAKKLEVVVDADVARSSGETEHPISSSCRRALNLMSENQHYFVACPKVLAEWRKHASGFAKRWLNNMIARKRVAFITASPDYASALAEIDMDDKKKGIAQKDAHLIDAARAKGLFVTSRDDTARTSIQGISELSDLCRGIAWVNPVSEAEILEVCLTRSRSKAPTLA
ncbi:hypothetical protein [Stenotrophomonas maltophilia]|uniref:hypothetical protein n=1 Tax=Stenotrophomonas maltophilia TaxID=40324 RepID=UPI0013D92832|nr:hypothetical protein [Stenotrophomonas maltophilia]